MFTARLRLHRIGEWAALAILALVGTQTAAAQNPQLGMVGLASGEILRLNVVAYPPSPCLATIGFRNANGQVPSPEPDRTVSLAPGQSAFLDLPASALGIAFGARREFQPVVTLQPQPQPDAPNACGASVEVFDATTGLSLVAIPEPEPSLPNVAPEFDMVGIALGQAVRLNVVAYPPNPCSAAIGFRDANGQAPQPNPSKTVYLNPGEAAFVDLPAGALGLSLGQRAELQPIVTLLPGANGFSACRATAEVYERVNGRTWALMTPQPQPDTPSPEPDLVGLAAGQVLRLNVVAFPPSPCMATIGFRDVNGQLPQPQPDKSVSLSPGQAAFIDLPASALGIPVGGRSEFQPMVALTPQPQPSAPNACGASVEIFDAATGLGRVAQPEPEPSLPNVAPQFGMVGIALGQIVRLNVLAFPPNPCSAAIGFLDANGQPTPEPDKTVFLNAGEGAFIDLAAGALGVPAGQRAELQPVVTMLGGADGASTCRATAEVFDRLTGRTWTLMIPQPEPVVPQAEPN
jgi:hypothetical protein